MKINKNMDGRGFTAFQIEYKDNVATALTDISLGAVVHVTGKCREEHITAVTDIPAGHKIAIDEIEPCAEVLKYGVCIGRATERILKGSWVHLHVMRSVYDERSSHLDINTGAPKDTKYE